MINGKINETCLNDLEKDNDFQHLIKKYDELNCFSIMGKSHKELWHSSFVQWFLDPMGNHCLRSFPLKCFLELLIAKGATITINERDLEEIKLKTEEGIEYKGLKGKIDIFGKCKSLILVIENKIDAKENFDKKTGEPQTDLYYKYCEAEYKNVQKCYVHLKADADSQVQNENFIPVTYQELFDNVIKRAYGKCDERKKSDTKQVLEQYATYLSNPKLRKNVIAYTEKEICEKIYSKHIDAFRLLRQTMNDTNRDEESIVCKFFDRYKLYINHMILDSLGENRIIRRPSEKLVGKALIDALVEDKYLIVNKTEMVYKTRLNKSFILKLNDDGKFYAGYYDGMGYDGTQEVSPLMEGDCPRLFDTYNKAAKEVEKAAGSNNRNGGESVYEFMLFNAGKKDAEGKTIRQIYSY